MVYRCLSCVAYFWQICNGIKLLNWAANRFLSKPTDVSDFVSHLFLSFCRSLKEFRSFCLLGAARLYFSGSLKCRCCPVFSPITDDPLCVEPRYKHEMHFYLFISFIFWKGDNFWSSVTSPMVRSHQNASDASTSTGVHFDCRSLTFFFSTPSISRAWFKFKVHEETLWGCVSSSRCFPPDALQTVQISPR